MLWYSMLYTLHYWVVWYAMLSCTTPVFILCCTVAYYYTELPYSTQRHDIAVAACLRVSRGLQGIGADGLLLGGACCVSHVASLQAAARVDILLFEIPGALDRESGRILNEQVVI